MAMNTKAKATYLLPFFHPLGKGLMKIIDDLGAAAIFLSIVVVNIFRRKQLREIMQQVYCIGARSSSIVMLIGLFTGMVLGLQLYYTLTKVGSEGFLGSVIALSLIRELGPVLTAIMITARAGSAMTAEIGILRISEQIDALYTMRIDPLRYLISPRMAAAIVSFPLLTAFFDLVGIMGGYLTTDLPDHLVGIRAYRHSMVETDLSIHIHWESEKESQRKSPLGLRISSALRNLGLLNHSVWVETTAREINHRPGHCAHVE